MIDLCRCRTGMGINMKSNEYEILYNTNQPGTENKAYEIGRVIDRRTERIITVLAFNANAYSTLHYHFGIHSPGYFTEIDIIMDDTYYPLISSSPSIFEALTMHEVGHLVNGDFDLQRDEYETSDNRAKQVLAGKVASEELAADAFAVYHCGKSAVISMLDYIIQRRKKTNTINDFLAIKELELRKKAVKKL